jgi:hypothetical protein
MLAVSKYLKPSKAVTIFDSSFKRFFCKLAEFQRTGKFTANAGQRFKIAPMNQLQIYPSFDEFLRIQAIRTQLIQENILAVLTSVHAVLLSSAMYIHWRIYTRTMKLDNAVDIRVVC